MTRTCIKSNGCLKLDITPEPVTCICQLDQCSHEKHDKTTVLSRANETQIG